MAARVSSSSRLAYPHHHHHHHHQHHNHNNHLNNHHPLSNPPIATSPPSALQDSSIAPSPSPSSSPFPSPLPSPSPSSSAPSSSPGSVFDPEPSSSTLSLAASDASGVDYSRPRLSPSTIHSPRFSPPATASIPPHSPLEPVAESTSSAASSPSLSRNRLHPPHPQPQRQQSGANSARGDLKTQRAGGFFAFAASALDRTQSAIAPTGIRRKRSLSRLSISGDTALLSRAVEPFTDKLSRHRPASLVPSSPSASVFSAHSSSYHKLPSSQSSPALEPIFSQPYTETDRSQPPPVLLPKVDNKMHQTSSRLLRMTDDDRPFTKDFKDLFATLIVSLLPLSAHRVRLTKVEHTFLSEDAINNLGSLKFSQSNRMPDPKDPSRIVTTTTTTTFSMAKDMARSICQRFLEARLIESADGKYQQVYTMKGSVWQLTPKGIAILDQFCSKNGIQQKQVAELIGNNLSTLVSLERDNSTDKLQTDRSTMEVVFRRFVGIAGFNIKSNITQADSEALTDYKDGLTGVKMAAERKIGGKTFKETFTGKAATDWLMDCSTTVDRRETVEIANYFVEYELMECVQQDRAHIAQYPGSQLFQPTKHSIYQLTLRGKDLISGNGPRGRASENEPQPREIRTNDKLPRDSNTQRLEKILSDPALRLLFRENLRETHCEENLSFYVDVDEFVKSCKLAIRQAQKNPSTTSMDGIKEIMAQAYGIYNAFLAPGSPCELNIDHQLRSNLATRMTKAVGQDVAMIDTLHEVTALFEDAQNAVFKLMASDSVPKFLRTPKYESVLKNYDFDSVQYSGKPLDRSQSRSNRK